MANETRDRRIERARSLFCSGLRMGEVAQSLGVGDSTVRRWRSRDEEQGLSWKELRRLQAGRGWETVIASLEGDLIGLAENKTLSPGARADAIFKVDQVIGNLRRRHTLDTGLRLDYTEELTLWARDNLDDVQHACFAEIITTWVDFLKRKAQEGGL